MAIDIINSLPSDYDSKVVRWTEHIMALRVRLRGKTINVL